MIDGIAGRPAGLGGPSPRLEASVPEAGGAARPAEAAAPQAPQRAELSPLATEARDAANAPIDKARVAELREAIANGNYKVDPERIAAKMVELDLGWSAKDGAA